MTYEEIIQKPGKQIEPKVYYYNEGTRVDLDRDQIILVHPSFKASLTGTVMKEMEVELKTQLPNTDIYIENTASYGTYTATKEFGRYRLNEVTYNADTKTYTHLLYDDMLKLMVDYSPINATYPISLYEWFSAFVGAIGYTTQINSLPNGSRMLDHDIYDGINFTNRDVLEDIGNATATLFGINNSEIIKVEFGTETKVVDDDILRNQNIKMGEHFGAINVVVLSRAGGSDNIYYPAELPENPIEYKITENQLMNDNNRSDYLPELYNALNGIEYDIFDCQLVGFGGFNPLDKVQIRTFENNVEKVYNSYVFNNDIKITQGYDESIYTPLPEKTNTNYKYADTTDKRINQTYLIVDKQNQTIEGVVSQVDEQNEQIATIRLQYNELLSKISDVADITTSAEETDASVSLENINTSQPISIKIHPIGENISYLYPYSALYPSSTLYPKSVILRFTNTTTSEVFNWYLPTNLWYLNGSTYDELELSYGDGTNSNVIVTRNCQINSSGVVSALPTPTTETYSYPSDIILTDGDYTVSILGYSAGYLYVQLMAKNIYTTQFYTKAETNSLIDQTASEITLGVNQTLSNYSTTSEMNSAINVKANEINSVVSTKVGNNEVISKINQSAEQVTINAGKINLNGSVTANNNFKILTDGSMEAKNGKFSGTISSGTIQGGSIDVNASYTELNPYIRVNDSASTGNEPVMTSIWSNGLSCIDYRLGHEAVIRTEGPSGGYAQLKGNHCDAFAFNNVSLVDKKKNFEKMSDAIEIVRNGDIYKYNWKSENDNQKKHIGLIIGDGYNTPDEVINEMKTGIDTYAMISVLWQAVKEQQEIIENLKERIEKLERQLWL